MVLSMSKGWFYTSGGVQQGPISIEDLKARHAVGQIPADALVWREGMGDWKPWNQVPELAGGQIYAAPASNPVAGSMGLKPPTYLWQSILCTLLCCLPFGSVGIVFEAKVDSLAAVGNMPAALEASNKAKFWCWMNFGFWFALVALYILLIIAGVLTGF